MIKKRAVLVISICSMIAPLYAQNNNSEVFEALIRAGDELAESGEKSLEAREKYKQALEMDPQSVMALHKIGNSFLGDYIRLGEPDRFLDSTLVYENRARMLNPYLIEAYSNEVEAYRLKWRHGMSRKVLMEALEHNPDNPQILMLTGRNYFDTGNPGLALPYLEKSIELGGDDAPGIAYRFAGWCWFYLEGHGKQLEYFNRFREIDPNSLMGIAGQVHSYTGLQEYDKATELAIQIRSDNPGYNYPAQLEAYIGETLLFGGNFNEAVSYYENALNIAPESYNLFATRAVTTTLGFLYMRSGKSEEAEVLLQETIERRMMQWEEMPERWEYSFDIASAYSVLGNTDKAYQWLYTSVLTGYPGHLWSSDPVFSNVQDEPAFRKLVKQARIRVEAEYVSINQ